MLDVAIIGGGLSGLSLAARLREAGTHSVGVFEARSRLGGRILSTPTAESDPDTRFDLGPTWVWPGDQPLLREFIRRYDLQLFPQFQYGRALFQSAVGQVPLRIPDPQAYSGAYRIRGGAQRLIDVLAEQLSPEQVYLEHRLLQVRQQGEGVALSFEAPGNNVVQQARRVVLCLPPRLLQQQVAFEPALDERLQQMFAATPTWMAGHAKVIVEYERPFWREQGLSGNGYGQYPGAVLGEIFDACGVGNGTEPGRAALGGFFALPAGVRAQHRARLEEAVISQLQELYGPAAAEPVAIHVMDWFQEPATAVAADADVPSEHPSYGHPWLRLDHWNETLWFGASETDHRFGGYLEGALQAAARVAADLTAS
ncbi:FAD-dependent oxidoreductase [Pseudomaricurvus sp. HS19]|uniref:flavin monoamine oxidase family protein n=1 Tax=Pseudomaricurvus sp. HS19 TaxID=2692626 RepID=UPI001369A10A|nr:FAD-dependent oxidoreductase [Pseudomaricurvus sp. HS19]MYM64900.1 NAD(P)-binding protein [Pseudomaricurvus sp. HS19]